MEDCRNGALDARLRPPLGHADVFAGEQYARSIDRIRLTQGRLIARLLARPEPGDGATVAAKSGPVAVDEVTAPQFAGG